VTISQKSVGRKKHHAICDHSSAATRTYLSNLAVTISSIASCSCPNRCSTVQKGVRAAKQTKFGRFSLSPPPFVLLHATRPSRQPAHSTPVVFGVPSHCLSIAFIGHGFLPLVAAAFLQPRHRHSSCLSSSRVRSHGLRLSPYLPILQRPSEIMQEGTRSLNVDLRYAAGVDTITGFGALLEHL
jgi:hypothetical protein